MNRFLWSSWRILPRYGKSRTGCTCWRWSSRAGRPCGQPSGTAGQEHPGTQTWPRERGSNGGLQRLDLLWDVHTELDLLLFPADHSVEDELPHLRLLGAGEVRPGEGVAVLLCDVTELAPSGDKRYLLRLLFYFLKRLSM